MIHKDQCNQTGRSRETKGDYCKCDLKNDSSPQLKAASVAQKSPGYVIVIPNKESLMPKHQQPSEEDFTSVSRGNLSCFWVGKRARRSFLNQLRDKVISRSAIFWNAKINPVRPIIRRTYFPNIKFAY